MCVAHLMLCVVNLLYVLLLVVLSDVLWCVVCMYIIVKKPVANWGRVGGMTVLPVVPDRVVNGLVVVIGGAKTK